MQTEAQSLTELGDWAIRYYAERLRPLLEPAHNGEAVAIHRDSGDYVLGRTHTAARREMAAQHKTGLVATLTVGPPTPADIAVAMRALAGGKV